MSRGVVKQRGQVVGDSGKAAASAAPSMFALAFALAAGCANTTGGALIPDLPFTAGGSTVATITSPLGWNITLTQALIALGPFYFNLYPPPSDEFRAGIVIIQATEQTIVNVLDPTMHAVVGDANGEAGTAVAVEIGLLTPDIYSQNQDPNDAFTIGPSAFGVIAGTAVKGSATVPFQGTLAVDQGLVTDTEPLADLQRIRGATVDLSFTAAPSTLELVVDPTHWFDQCDFSQLCAGSGSGSGCVGPPPMGGYTWTTDNSTFAAQLLQGVKSEDGVYQFSLVPN